MNTFESDVAQLNTGDRIREANRQRLGPTEGGGDQQVSDLKRLCFRHWLYLMLASLLDAPTLKQASISWGAPAWT